MAKITISRLFEISKYLTTKSGQELEGALQYLSEFAEVSLRTLRNGLTFSDNFDATIKTVTLKASTETVVGLSGTKRAVYIIPLRVSTDTFYIQDKFGWKYNSNAELVVFSNFVDSSGNAPASTFRADLALLILFG